MAIKRVFMKPLFYQGGLVEIKNMHPKKGSDLVKESESEIRSTKYFPEKKHCPAQAIMAEKYTVP